MPTPPLRRLRGPLIGLAMLPLGYGLLLLICNLGAGRWLLQQWLNGTYGQALQGRVRIERLIARPPLRLEIRGGLDAPTLRVEEAVVTLEGLARGAGRLGTVRARRLTLGQITVEEMTGDLRRSQDGYTMDHLRGRLYASGMLTGTLRMVTRGAAPAFTLQLQADRVALGELAPLNPTLFRGAEGSGHGTLTVAEAAGAPPRFAARFRVQQPGGAVQAPFLAAILPYVPAAAQTAALRQTVADGRPVRFNTASVSLEAVSPQELKALLLMTLPDYNVHLDVEVTIRLDEAAALQHLLMLWNRLTGSAS